MASEAIPALPGLPGIASAAQEIELNGYRAVAVKASGKVKVFLRRHKSFDEHYPSVEALHDLPEDTL